MVTTAEKDATFTILDIAGLAEDQNVTNLAFQWDRSPTRIYPLGGISLL